MPGAKAKSAEARSAEAKDDKYPRMMYHPTKAPRVVNSDEEREALGPEWTETYSPFDASSE